ncbi:hypothetical protein T484DRAFT_3353315 [Baffinella frigidus]|nr:hypothetical protein T484DRAFT_3353315 [Cryptophyta sp. CCMP2293]
MAGRTRPQSAPLSSLGIGPPEFSASDVEGLYQKLLMKYRGSSAIPVAPLVADIDRGLVFEALGRQAKNKIPLILAFLQEIKRFARTRPKAQRADGLDLKTLLGIRDAMEANRAPAASRQRIKGATEALEARLALEIEHATSGGNGAMRATAVENAFRVLVDIHAALYLALPAYSRAPHHHSKHESDAPGAGFGTGAEGAEGAALLRLAMLTKARLKSSWGVWLSDGDHRVRSDARADILARAAFGAPPGASSTARSEEASARCRRAGGEWRVPNAPDRSTRGAEEETTPAHPRRASVSRRRSGCRRGVGAPRAGPRRGEPPFCVVRPRCDSDRRGRARRDSSRSEAGRPRRPRALCRGEADPRAHPPACGRRRRGAVLSRSGRGPGRAR